MAIGFTPKHSEVFSLSGLTNAQFTVLAFEAATQLKWSISYVTLNGMLADTNNGLFKFNAEISIKISNGSAQITSASSGNEFVDWGKNKKNVLQFIATIESLQKTMTNDQIDERLAELQQYFVPAEEDIFLQAPPTKAETIKNTFSIFVPTENYFVTPILILLNSLLFILMVLSGANLFQPDNESLLTWGANFKPLTLGGEWWRLFTNCFEHIGILHLLMNMYALLYIGVLLEPLLGKWRFATVYILTGLSASMTSLWWHDLTISAGASGAIFGMYGVFLALLTTKLIEENTRKSLLSSIGVFVVYNLVFGLSGGVDNAAHIGGLLSGMIVGYALFPALRAPLNKSLNSATLALLTIAVLSINFYVYSIIPNDIAIYEQKIKVFSAQEEKALSIFTLPSTTDTKTYLSAIKNEGLENWKKNLTLLNELSTLQLPANISLRNIHLKEYCELRIKFYQILYKAIEENTNIYDGELENLGKQIDAKLEQINKE